MTVVLIVPTGINLLTYVNDTLISARRRGFDGTIELPTLRERARAVVHGTSLMKFDETVQPDMVGVNFQAHAHNTFLDTQIGQIGRAHV